MAEEDIPERDPTEALLEDLIQCGWCSLGTGTSRASQHDNSETLSGTKSDG